MHRTDLAWKALVSCIVVLQFDGSFRPPKDPGYPTLETKLATCAACLSTASDCGANYRPLALGSRFLPVPVGMTSGHAEYEGLLLGLEWLSTKNKDFMGESKQDLIVQGDCKTVIDQLSGKSHSRKLQIQHKQAQLYLQDIGQNFNSIEYQYIPRNLNSICDNLCANTITAAASCCWNSCLTEIENMENPILDIVTRNCLLQSSWVRYSIRPLLHAKMFQAAQKQQDYEAMIIIGDLLFTESQKYSKVQKSAIKAHGVLYQLIGMRGLGQERKASALERKHRMLLKSCPQLQNDGESSIPTWHQLRRTGKASVSWDVDIPIAWISMLNEFWAKAESMKSWEEGSTIWEQDTDFLAG